MEIEFAFKVHKSILPSDPIETRLCILISESNFTKLRILYGRGKIPYAFMKQCLHPLRLEVKRKTPWGQMSLSSRNPHWLLLQPPCKPWQIHRDPLLLHRQAGDTRTRFCRRGWVVKGKQPREEAPATFSLQVFSLESR